MNPFHNSNKQIGQPEAPDVDADIKSDQKEFDEGKDFERKPSKGAVKEEAGPKKNSHKAQTSTRITNHKAGSKPKEIGNNSKVKINEEEDDGDTNNRKDDDIDSGTGFDKENTKSEVTKKYNKTQK